MKIGKVCAAALMAVLAAGCGANNPTVSVTVSPTSVTVILLGTEQFSAIVGGSPTTTVTWGVSAGNPGDNKPITGGNSTLGTISVNGLYTAPVALPSPPKVTITATSTANSKATGTAVVTLDSGIRVSVIPVTASCANPPIAKGVFLVTNQTFGFTACVTGTPNPSVTWSVSSGPNGSISSAGVYTAPGSAVSGVTITATPVADPTIKSGTATVTVAAAVAPTLTGLSAASVPQGSILQDIYANGSNFATTSQVQVGGSINNVTTTFLSQTLLRARLSAPLLQSATPSPLSITVQTCGSNFNIPPQLCTVNVGTLLSGPLPLAVAPQRSALIGLSPGTFVQGSPGPAPTTLNGGFLTTSTVATFNGVTVPTSPNASDTRNLPVNLPGSAFTTAGLFPLAVQTCNPMSGSGPTPPCAVNQKPTLPEAINVAVQPPLSSLATSAPPPTAVGTAPSAVAIDTALWKAVVANSGSANVSVVDLSSLAVVNVGVGSTPTGVAVDNLYHRAYVVNSASNSVSVLDITGPSVIQTIDLTGATPVGSTPFSIGVNPLTQRAVVANTSTNTATILDLTKVPSGNPVLAEIGNSVLGVNTGPNPQVAVDARMNRAVVTPGGSGTVSMVDLGRPATTGDGGRPPAVYATNTITPGIQGVGINTETEQAFLTDPNNTAVTTFSLLDQGTSSFTLDKNELAAAVNPLTNEAVTVNPPANTANVFDMSHPQTAPHAVTVGTNPVAVAVDPGTNAAVVANKVGNSVSVFSLGAIRPLHVTQICISPASPFSSTPSTPSLPCLPFTFTSPTPLVLTVVGHGFTGGATPVVRLDQAALATTVLSDREITAVVPVGMLASARLYGVDVLDTTSLNVSNITDLMVVQAVGVSNNPMGVAVDSTRDLAVVTNSGDQPNGTISVVDLKSGTAAAAIPVEVNPQGVALLPFTGQASPPALAVVTNNGNKAVSFVDYVNKLVVGTTLECGSCLGPLGVGVNSDTQTAFVADSTSSDVSTFNLAANPPTGGGLIGTDEGPVGVAVDPVDNIIAITAAVALTNGQGQTIQTPSVDLINGASDLLTSRISNLSAPRGIVFDPVSGQFVAVDGGQNDILLINPLTQNFRSVRVGINPTSLDDNFQTETLVTVNTLSNTISLVNMAPNVVQAREILDFSASSQFSIAVDPGLNLAVVTDGNNNRVLLIPLP